MKKNIFSFLLVYCLLFTVSCPAQVKIIKATVQKTFGGTAGVFMNYMIEFKNKTPAQVEVDSVKSIADSSQLDFNFRKNEKGSYEITFKEVLVKPEKCKTCRDVTPKNANLTKGVNVYYRRGEEKYLFKAKKFKQLAVVKMP
jgi:hypothetical protein